ncbi:acyltransferase family protein [Herbaspirillum sp. C7C8]|uniref:acyltransferase family protein n=1 Tax=Herbaspirillum sp. C7C8 TaxID=2736665 RepID=UPI001F523E84|nr:acyltransferase family protein [Herbaspirillum sp. C7C8]MCI1004766.1 acyltransferase family protein [Herbaspirillum sp. C7C8]
MQSPKVAAGTADSRKILAVQGLRGIAVLAVLLFHVKFTTLAGGYQGPDIFFVISGFVITLLLRRRIEAGTFSFLEFYMRRAWRLLPALIVTLVLTAVVFSILTPISINNTLLPSLVASAAGVANLYYAGTIDYFASGTSNPVLHTWSLGVEEQFYLVFPLLAVILARHTRKPVLLLLGLCLASFAAAVVATGHDATAAFYLPWYRGWEFLAGAVVAYIDQDKLKPRFSNFLSVAGFLLMMGWVCFYKESYIFPGIGALGAVLGTAMALLGSRQENWVNKLLSVTPLARLGDMSYSVYLVHWPVVCLIGMFFPLERPSHQLVALLLSLVLGYLCWRLIEQPVLKRYRPARSASGWLVVPAVFALTAAIIASISYGAEGLWQRNPMAMRYLEPTPNERAMFREGQCFLSYRFGFETYDKRVCLQGDMSKPGLLVMGDSLAANIALALQEKMPEYNILQATAVEYRLSNPSGWPDFAQRLDQLVWGMDGLGGRRDIKMVVLFARWGDDDLDGLPKVIDRLKAHGVKVVVLGPSPEFYISLPLILAYSKVTGLDLTAIMNKPERSALNTRFTNALASKVEYISMMDVICPKGRCDVTEGKERISLFLDKIHFSRPGAELFASRVPLH